MIETVGDKCVGCGACASSCKMKCIEITANDEGFLYPKVNKDKCINCGICDKVCPALYNEPLHNINDAEIYGIRPNKENQHLVNKSASAGVFYFMAKAIIKKGGYIFGAVFDESHEVKHICGKTLDDISRMQNSKYVQSDTTGIFAQIQDIFNANTKTWLLFCGTPCQCLGLQSFLGRKYDNLFLVDLLCHGVPSPLAFKKYLHYLEQTKNETVKDFQFRCKYKGWNYHGYMSSYVKLNNHYWPTVRDPYMSSFLKMRNYRESCYSCKYNTVKKCADISLADFSGVRDIAPNFFTKVGCSEVYIHSEKGRFLLQLIEQYIESIPLNPKDLEGFNSILKKERVRPVARNFIYKGINEMNDKTYVETKLMKGISKKSIIRFYTPYLLRKFLSKFLSRKK